MSTPLPTNVDKRLIEAVMSNSLIDVNAALNGGASLDYTDGGVTALENAAGSQHCRSEEILAALIRKATCNQIRKKNKYNQSLLTASLQCGKLYAIREFASHGVIDYNDEGINAAVNNCEIGKFEIEPIRAALEEGQKFSRTTSNIKVCHADGTLENGKSISSSIVLKLLKNKTFANAVDSHVTISSDGEGGITQGIYINREILDTILGENEQANRN
jgi:hypothetical protein